MLFILRKVRKIAFFWMLLALTSCATMHSFSGKEARTLDALVGENPVLSNIHSGFALYDPVRKEWLYQRDAHKYYTPASNTKLFTLYAFMTVCGDSLPAIRYTDGPGLRYVQGTGNPLLLHPELPGDEAALDVLLSTRAQLVFNTDNYEDDRLGPGWSWADYSYGYQAEKSPMPVYGNLIQVTADTLRTGFEVHPDYYRTAFRYDPALDERNGVTIRREEFSNRFTHNSAAADTTWYERYLPIYDVAGQVPVLLSDSLNRTVTRRPLPDSALQDWQTVYSPTPDTLLRQFMQDSDNFLAEQLLLCVSAELFDGRLNSRAAIDSVKNNWLADLPDEPRWVDGSGLSRYNLFTPRTMVRLLEKMRTDFGEEYLFSILAAGGASGTIANWYAGPDGQPYVFAKTGTLSNKHALSGYLRTDNGRTLIFSFMHNNYLGSSGPVKVEMEKILSFIREVY